MTSSVQKMTSHELNGVKGGKEVKSEAQFDVWNSRTKSFALLLVVLASMAYGEGCGSYRVRSDWELPQGFHGWVLVEQSNPNCPKARFTFATVIFRVDASGRGCVSTPLPKAPQYATFWEIGAQGRRKRELRFGAPGNGGEIWDLSVAQASNEFVSIREATQFFVGTEAQYNASLKDRPKWWLKNVPSDSSSR